MKGHDGCVYSGVTRRGRAEPRRVELTGGQRARPEELWFVYGNRGPKATMENHGFIQGFLERASDERDFYKPTAECLAAVDAALGHADFTGSGGLAAIKTFRLSHHSHRVESPTPF